MNVSTLKTKSVSQYLQMITGSPVIDLKIKKCSNFADGGGGVSKNKNDKAKKHWKKLKNLEKHDNIKGFAIKFGPSSNNKASMASVHCIVGN